MLAGAGLLLRSLHELSRVDPGFEPARVLSFRVSGNYAEFGDYPRLLKRIDTALEQLRALPGVEASATSFSAPGVPTGFQIEFELVEARGDQGARMVAESRVVSPEYFETLRIPLLEGPLCRRQTRDATELMVNRSFAERNLAGRSSVSGFHLANPNANVPPAASLDWSATSGKAGWTRHQVQPCISVRALKLLRPTSSSARKATRQRSFRRYA